MNKIETRAPPSAPAVARGAAWATVDIWTQQGLGLVTFIVIGNLVGPHAYGVMAIALTYQLLVSTLLRDNFAEALIQRVALEPNHIDTAFSVLLAFSVAAALVSVPVAYLLAATFGEPELVMVVSALAVTFPLMTIANLMRGLLRRALNFRALALRSLISFGVSSALAIVLALRGYGLMSLVVYQITIHVLDLLCLAVQSGIRPRPRFSRAHYKDLADFAYKTMGNNFAGTFANQIDRLIIGYFIGTLALGLYGMGRRIVEGIDQTVLGVINAIALPTLTPYQSQHEALAGALTKATHYSSLIAFPAYAGLALVAGPLIAIGLNPEWAQTGHYVTILCLAGFCFPPVLFLTTTQRAIGQAGLVLKLSLTSIAIRIAGSLAAIALGFGVMGVLIVIASVGYLLLPLRIYLVRRSIGLSARRFVFAMAAPAGATALMALAVFGVDRGLAGRVDPVLLVALAVIVGVAAYGAAIFALAGPSLLQMRNALLARSPKATAA